MKTVKRILALILTVAIIALIHSMLSRTAASKGYGIQIQKAANEAVYHIASAGAQISEKLSQLLNKAAKNAAKAAGITDSQSNPAIPVTSDITSNPNTDQSEIDVTPPAAGTDINDPWGETGIKDLCVYEYGKTLLTEKEKNFYYNIAAAVRNVEPSIEITTTLKPSQVKMIYEYYIYDHSEVFYISGLDLTYSNIGAVYTYKLAFNYKYNGSKSKITEMRKKLGEKALEVLKTADKYKKDLEKEKALHDKLIKMCSYDTEAAQNFESCPESFTAYGPLVNKKAVCQGYAQAMKLLLSSAGIKTLYITGQAGGAAHAWNLVNIGNKWRYLDVTFDDPVYYDSSGKYVSYNTVSYTYFNFIKKEDHLVGTFDEEDPFGEASENYKIMPKVAE